jgi:transcriptional regulator with XRE-family HTH domain
MPSPLRQHSGMAKNQKTPRRINETRYRNFQLVLQRFEQQEPGKGVLRRFAEKVGVSESYLSQVKNRVKNVGPELAQTLERELKLGPGWMDVEHKVWEPRDAGEMFFLQTAMTLYRKSPAEIQQELIQKLSELLGPPNNK